MKKAYLIIMFLWLFLWFSFANTESFSIKTQSLNGDYIWQGDSRNFSSDNNDFISVNKTNNSAIELTIESFSISYINFEFGVGLWQTLQAWMLYEPAKRYAFRDSYHWIDISGGGRWCNEILWAFYVHEYQYSNNTLQKLAIDFVQYCEGNTNKPLYGSIRYNSSIAHSCNDNNCSWVQSYISKTQNNTTKQSTQPVQNNDSLSTIIDHQITQLSQDTVARISTKYPLFYSQCAVPELYWDDIFVDNESKINYINKDGCEGKYKQELMIINKLLIKLFWPKSSGQDEEISIEELEQALVWIDMFLNIINEKRDYAASRNTLPTSIDIMFSALWYYMEMAKLWINILML